MLYNVAWKARNLWYMLDVSDGTHMHENTCFSLMQRIAAELSRGTNAFVLDCMMTSSRVKSSIHDVLLGDSMEKARFGASEQDQGLFFVCESIKKVENVCTNLMMLKIHAQFCKNKEDVVLAKICPCPQRLSSDKHAVIAKNSCLTHM